MWKILLILMTSVLLQYETAAQKCQKFRNLNPEDNEYCTYGSLINANGAPFDRTTLIGFRSSYSLELEPSVKKAKGGEVYLQVKRLTIGATDFQRFSLNIYSKDSTAAGAPVFMLENLSISNDKIEDEYDGPWINSGSLLIDIKLPYVFWVWVEEESNPGSPYKFKVTQ